MSAQYDHFQLGTHPVTGEPWAYCLACRSGNGPTIEALRTACRRVCSATFYDQWGHSYTPTEAQLHEQEMREERGEPEPEQREPSRIIHP